MFGVAELRDGGDGLEDGCECVADGIVGLGFVRVATGEEVVAEWVERCAAGAWLCAEFGGDAWCAKFAL